VAKLGLAAPHMRERFLEIFERAPEVLSHYGFNSDSLKQLVPNIESYWTPATQMKDLYRQSQKLNPVMESLSWLYTLDGRKI
jgi:hypothetical protein